MIPWCTPDLPLGRTQCCFSSVCARRALRGLSNSAQFGDHNPVRLPRWQPPSLWARPSVAILGSVQFSDREQEQLLDDPRNGAARHRPTLCVQEFQDRRQVQVRNNISHRDRRDALGPEGNSVGIEDLLKGVKPGSGATAAHPTGPPTGPAAESRDAALCGAPSQRRVHPKAPCR